MNPFLALYRGLFARPAFFRLNRLLYRCSLAGLGVQNYESDAASGEGRFLRGLLAGRQDPVVLDVGANIGDYSSKVLRANPSAVVHAFEPHPETFRRLTDRLRGPRFHAVQAAAASATGMTTLYDYATEGGSSHASLYREVIEGLHEAPAVGHEVQALRLADYLAAHGIGRVDLLKIDTEGHELEVLRGLGELLAQRRIAAIHFEFNEMNVASRTFFRDFWTLLADYDLYRLLPHGMLRIEAYSAELCEIFAYQNLVAILKRA